MIPAVLNLYDLLFEFAFEKAPESEEGYLTDIHTEWRKQLETMGEPTTEQAYRIKVKSDHLETNLKAGLSFSALSEWMDAYPDAIQMIMVTPRPSDATPGTTFASEESHTSHGRNVY